VSVPVDKKAFGTFLEQNERTYSSFEEYEHRAQVFSDNKAYAENLQRSVSYDVSAHGPFGDMTHDEYQSMFRNEYPMSRKGWFRTVLRAPESVNWVEKGAVSPVQNQMQCGSCWAFSTKEAIEGIHAIKTGNLISLSAQELVDCCSTCSGCSGGLMPLGFQCVIDWGGIVSDSCYPYKAHSQQCESGCSKVASISGYREVQSGDENALMNAGAKQPISIAIYAASRSFQMYSGGVYDDTSCDGSLDHGVLLAGYGTDSGTPYWLVKNSWGQSWGEEGYIRIARKDNICRVLDSPSYPIM
jgi:C1A family cysteine protease